MEKYWTNIGKSERNEMTIEKCQQNDWTEYLLRIQNFHKLFCSLRVQKYEIENEFAKAM
jgi:hypothetical protein